MSDIETNNSLCFLPKRGHININNNFQPLTLYSVLVGYFKYSLFLVRYDMYLHQNLNTRPAKIILDRCQLPRLTFWDFLK